MLALLLVAFCLTGPALGDAFANSLGNAESIFVSGRRLLDAFANSLANAESIFGDATANSKANALNFGFGNAAANSQANAASLFGMQADATN
ncbi:hypothetical protein WJX73_001015 [Symbiochloris irregularis]|uniref:Uncharacterized protein n=1 Tax=Symbiochloris irregularis TaxID=706552 RepID=A0AAW1PI64_9CHLO